MRVIALLLQFLFQLPPSTSAVTGRVLAEDGAPISGATVMLTAPVYRDGELSLAPLFSAPSETRTSSSGEYRLSAPAGSWYVLVSGSGFVPTYMRVVARTDTESRATDITLPKAVPVTISGTVTDSESGRPVGRVRIFAIRSISGLLQFQGTTDDQGRYRITSVVPGQYRMHTMSPPGDRRFAAATVIVPNQDVNVDFTFRPRVSIDGYSVFEGVDTALMRGRPPGIMANSSENSNGAGTSFGFDGEFRLMNLVESSKYYVTFKDLPEDWYVKSATYGSTNLLAGTLDARGTAADRIRIAFANGTRLHGLVRDAAGKRVSVLLIDTAPQAIPRVGNRLVFAEASGEFTFRGVPPGTYRVFAVEQPFVGREQDPEFLRDFESRGTLLTLSAGKPAEVTLDIER